MRADRARRQTMAAPEEIVDVIVVGTGCAGCAAAVGALLNGAKKVVVLEKSPKLIGGTTKLAGGGWVWVPNNKYLRELGINQPVERCVRLLADLAYPDDAAAADPGDLALMRAFVEECPRVMDELMAKKLFELDQVRTRSDEDTGKVRALLESRARPGAVGSATGYTAKNIEALAELMPSYCADHPLDACPSGNVLSPAGGSTSQQLEQAVRSFGDAAEIRTGWAVDDIITTATATASGGGRAGGGRGTRASSTEVVGVRAYEAATKTHAHIRARRGVIFASGGFSHSKELLEGAFGRGTISGTCAAKTNTGDLVSIARRHGIPVSDEDLRHAWLKQVVLPFNPRRSGVFFLNADSFIVVDRFGRRFADEKNFYQQRGSQMLEDLQRKRFVFFVFDQRSRDLFEGPLRGLGGPIPFKKMFPEQAEACLIVSERGDAAELGARIDAKLEEIFALDAAAGPGKSRYDQDQARFRLDAGFGPTLGHTIEQFNGYATRGEDPDFGRHASVAEYCWHVNRAKDNKHPCKTMAPLDTSGPLYCVVMGLSTLDTKGGPRIDASGRILGEGGRPVPGLYGAGNCVKSFTRSSYPASGVTMASAITFGFVAGRECMKAGQQQQQQQQQQARARL